MFQNPDDQLFMPTVFDDVAFGPLNLGMDETSVRERVCKALNMVNSLALQDKPPHHLSCGQKSAVAIASVMAMEPDILAMDEPAANLDPKSRRSLITLLKTFEHSKIIASHDLDLILDVCERCIVIGDGAVVADGPSTEILSEQESAGGKQPGTSAFASEALRILSFSIYDLPAPEERHSGW